LVLAAITDARRLGAPAALPFNLGAKAEIDFCVGDWPSAYAAALQGVELSYETGQPPLAGYSLATLAYIEAAQGQENECRAHAQSMVEIRDQFGATFLYVYAGSALGLLELGCERPEAARSHLAPLLEWIQSNGWHGVLTKERFASDLIEATIRSGDSEEAARLLDSFEWRAEKTGRIWARAAAARCRALLVNDASAGGLFERALVLHSQTTTPFDEARTNLCYGEWLRRSGRPREAVRALGAARGTLERLGATPWLTRAIRELAAVGETVTPSTAPWSSELTPQELQVALTVSEGLTNKEAASELFVSPKTVEFHLGNIYRKLDIHSRSQLVRMLSRASSGSIAD
jgi:DNA-binding CsgD family transcriptional regulator